MKSPTFVLLALQSLCHYTDGFSLVTTPSHTSNPSRSALCATNEEHNKGASIAVAVALGWAMASSPSLAAPLSNDWTTTTTNSGSSSFVVALSDSDFADFSLPSYKDALTSEINSNLKGDKMLFGEEAVASASSPSGDSGAAAEPAAVQKKEPSAAEIKAEKAAAKAATKAAREAQQAAVEAALAAK